MFNRVKYCVVIDCGNNEAEVVQQVDTRKLAEHLASAAYWDRKPMVVAIPVGYEKGDKQRRRLSALEIYRVAHEKIA